MKKWLILPACCLLVAASIAQDIGVHNNSNTWQNTFTSDKLTDADLIAFEDRAKQKLTDLYGLLEIVADGKYEMKLRQDAKKQAVELFSSRDSKIYGISINTLLDSLLKTNQASGIEISPPQVIENFRKEKALNIYSGTLSISLKYQNEKNKKVVSASILLIKTEKLFGTEKKQVWTVYLSEIK